MYALKIVKCSDNRKWYRDLIGETVPLLCIEDTEYKSREPEGYINFVSVEDAEVIQVQDEN